MRKILLGLILTIPLFGQGAGTPNCQFTYELTNRPGIPTDGITVIAISGGAARTPAINNLGQQCNSWYMSVAVDGLSVVSLELDDAQNRYTIGGGAPVSWAAFEGTINTGTNPTTAITSSSLNVTGFYPWISVDLASSTGTGNVYVTLYGWKSPALLGSTGSGGGGGIVNANFVFGGDSLFAGNGPTVAPNNIPTMVATLPAFSGHGSVTNTAVSGRTCPNILAAYTAEVHPISPTVTGKAGYYFIMCGTNNINADTPATTYATIQSIWAAAKADGYKVIAFTIPRESPFGSSSSAINANVDALDNLIRSGGLPSSNLYDYMVDTEVMFPDPYSTNWFQSDTIHLSVNGNIVFARRINDTLATFGSGQLSQGADHYISQGTGIGNVRLNLNAMPAITTGTSNTVGGDQAGISESTGTNNTFLGVLAGSSTTAGDNNVFIGRLAGGTTTSTLAGDIFIGQQAGQNETASSSIGIGAFALIGDTGGNNTAVGVSACSSITSGNLSTCLGWHADMGTATTGSVQLGPGTDTTNGTIQFQSYNMMDSSGNYNDRTLKASTLFSAAGTPLPTCNAGAKGTQAIVSDATLPTLLGIYTSGGAVLSPVVCNGTNWVTY